MDISRKVVIFVETITLLLATCWHVGYVVWEERKLLTHNTTMTVEIVGL